MDRAEREKAVVSRMIAMYCRRHHAEAGGGLCEECLGLERYVHKRIDLCPKGDRKSSCRKCEIHCYAPGYRAEVRRVMRYAGPRMFFMHPLSALRHLASELFRAT